MSFEREYLDMVWQASREVAIEEVKTGSSLIIPKKKADGSWVRLVVSPGKGPRRKLRLRIKAGK